MRFDRGVVEAAGRGGVGESGRDAETVLQRGSEAVEELTHDDRVFQGGRTRVRPGMDGRRNERPTRSGSHRSLAAWADNRTVSVVVAGLVAAPRSYDDGMGSEVYPNAPLALVVCEIRFPLADQGDEGFRRLRTELKDVLPLGSTEVLQRLDLGPGGQQHVESVEILRLKNREKTTSVSFWPDRAIVETTAYAGFERFRGLVERAVTVVEMVLAPGGVERVGLRYIDEIRPAVTSGSTDWREWVVSELIGPSGLEIDGITATAWQGLTQFVTPEGTSVVLRYGPRETPAVDPNGILRRVNLPANPECFLLDFDSYWTAEGHVPEYSAGAVLEKVDVLHRPLTETFEKLVTSRMREAMRGRFE